jgi:carbamoyl-phosphate synthase large subunit
VVIRPSYVLGGRAMEIVRDREASTATSARPWWSPATVPVLLDSYLSGAVEVDVDALCDGDRPCRGHHGAYRGSRRAFRRQRLFAAAPHAAAHASTRLIRPDRGARRALNVVGLMNVQFAVKDGEIYLLEVNPRASRTVPFVAKATDSAIASIAARSWPARSSREISVRALQSA